MIKHLALIPVAIAGGYLISQSSFVEPIAKVAEERITADIISRYYDSFERPLRAGNYLASRHAQIHHDWKNADLYVQKLIDNDINSQEIMQRAMVLALGGGNAERAISIAHDLKAENPNVNSTIADILLITESIKKKDYRAAQKQLNAIPKDGTMRFIEPFLNGWIMAANGKLDIKNLQSNTVQLYHGILISDFLNDHSQMQKMIDHAMSVEDITNGEIERMADLYGHAGLNDKAVSLYERILKTDSGNTAVQGKIDDIKSGKITPLFDKIKDAEHGIGQSYNDISKILYNESNDETARVFAHLALYVAPDLTETKFLLAKINTRHKQYDEALALYKSIEETDPDYVLAQHEIATIYEETGRIDDALAMLEGLVSEKNDVDTLIKIGDLNRHQSNFGLAIKAYDRAVAALDGELPDEYWHLHYVRGMSYEQADNWQKAEEELQNALKYRPDHPYILNYLGYAWADKGINLDQALSMIKRASELRPSDGYITDSLGWILYRIEDYQKAVTVLEKAVELLPYDPTVNDHLGDAYWKVGRKLEARFQWERAKNHSEDSEQVAGINAKLSEGLE